LIFKGDLTKSNPPDLLMFIAQMGKEGLLNVNKGDKILNISIKNGKIADAYSDASDIKLLRMLYFEKLIDKEQLKRINRAREETKMPVGQILDNLQILDVSKITDKLEIAIKEVIFEFFLWDSGQFHFTDIIIDNESHNINLDCMGVLLDVTTQVDEWREISRNLQTLERVLVLTDNVKQAQDLTKIQKTVLRLVNSERTIEQLVFLAPYSSYATLKTVNHSVTQGWLTARPLREKIKKVDTKTEVDSRFGAFKRALKKLMQTDETPAKIEQLVTFCKEQFDQTLILTIDQNQLIQVRKSTKDKHGIIRADDIQNVEIDINPDPVFSWVCTSNIPFFGKVFPSKLLAQITDIPDDGDCAVLPLFKIGNRSLLCFVFSESKTIGISPFQYLELMSWQISPPKEDSSITIDVKKAEQSEISKQQDTSKKEVSSAELLVRTVNELPPMPHIVNEILKLLSDPNTSLNDLTEVMANDQALVARIIRVSNSALYGGRNEISILSQAVTRLGLKLIRSLVLVSSVRSFFPKSDSSSQNWGQALWQHSKECGLACRRVAKLIRYEEPDEALVAGILHDIGKLVILLKLPEKYKEIRKLQSHNSKWSIDIEREILGFDHIEVGLRLMKKWKIPTNLLSGIQLHHKPELAENFKQLAYIVGFGDYLCHKFGSQADEAHLADYYNLDDMKQILKISDGQIETLGEDLQEDFKQANIFD